MSFFNLKESNLNENDYFIVENNFSENNLRILKQLETNNGFYLPIKTGSLSVDIIFKKKINILDNFFINNKELIKVNMSHFEMNEVESMKSIFSGC